MDDRLQRFHTILSQLPGLISPVETDNPLTVSRFLSRLIDDLKIDGACVAILDNQKPKIVAKQGASQVFIDEVMSKAQSEDIEAISPRRTKTSLRLKIEDRDVAIFSFPLNDSSKCVCSYWSTSGFNEDLEHTLYLIALHISRLLNVANLNNKIRELSEEIERRKHELKEIQVSSLNMMEDLQRKNRDLKTLNALTLEIAQCTEIESLFDKAVLSARELVEGASVAIYTIDDTSGTLHLRRSTSDEDCKCTEIIPEQQTIQLIERFSEADCIELDPRLQQQGIEIVGPCCKSGLILPLRSKNKILGIVVVYQSRWYRIFGDDLKAILISLASKLAVAIENSRLIARITEQIDEITYLKEYIETVIESVDIGILVVDKDFKITLINRGWEKIYRRKKEEFLGRNAFEAFPHIKNQGFEKIAELILQGKSFVRRNWKRKILDGREVVQNMRIIPHRDAKGEIAGAIVITEDVTEKQRLESELAKSEAKFKNLVEELVDGYLVVIDGKIAYANRAACQMTGLEPSVLLGKKLTEVVGGVDVKPTGKPSVDHLRRESRLLHASGTWIPVEISMNTCEYDGQPAVSIVMRDITERKRFEKELEEKNRQMRLRTEQISRLNLELESTINRLKKSQENLIKSERLAAITETAVTANHEINNPLFSILGHAQLLLRKHGKGDEETYRRLKAIEESALRIACVTKKLANLADPVVKEYPVAKTGIIDVETSRLRLSNSLSAEDSQEHTLVETHQYSTEDE